MFQSIFFVYTYSKPVPHIISNTANITFRLVSFFLSDGRGLAPQLPQQRQQQKQTPQKGNSNAHTTKKRTIATKLA